MKPQRSSNLNRAGNRLRLRYLPLVLLALAPAIPQAQQASRTESSAQDHQALEIHQLPWHLRRELPELKVTVRHAAREPDNRFVKINGDRFKEGDRLDNGVSVIEIRADGVILEYQGQRIIVH